MRAMRPAYDRHMRASSRFLLSGLVAAASTATAVRPIVRAGRVSRTSFALGFVPSELPLQTGVVELGTAMLLARSGGTTGWRGYAGLAAYAASFGGLAFVHRTALRSGDVLEQALVDELGADYRHRITAGFTPRPEVPLTRRQLVRPEFRVRGRYRTARDVSYGDAGVRNHLDVWRRSDLPLDGRAPVLFQVHGGAWMIGKKEGQAEPLMAHLAERGWVCVAANYRLSPRATWPDHIVDVKKALAWTKATIAEHGGDPDFIVITGGSAGGHLSALTALTPHVREWQPGFEDVDTSVAAAVPFYGIYDFSNGQPAEMAPFLTRRVFKSELARDRARWEQASPITHVGPHAPPFFVLHGTNDSLAPIDQSTEFVHALRKESHRPVVFAQIPGAQHAFETFPSVRAHATVHAIERFLAVVRSERG